VEDFLTPVDPRYARVFGVFWSSFRNGIVHGSWPQAICVQGHGGRRIAVGASPVRGGEHFQRASDYAGPSFVISSVTFFQDIERSFDQGFRSWIMSQSDDAVLTSVSGVGKKLAGRVILELKEKVAAAGMAAAAATGSGRGGERAGVSEGEVIAALQALGYTPTEARDAARAAAGRASPDASLEDRVKTALRGLARG